MNTKKLKSYNRNVGFSQYNMMSQHLTTLKNGNEIRLIALMYNENQWQVHYYKAFEIKDGTIIKEVTEDLKCDKLKYYKKIKGYAVKTKFKVEITTMIEYGALTYEKL